MAHVNKATILLIPGGWHKPSVYAPVITYLQKAAYEAHAIPLHSVGAHPVDTSFDNDVASLREELIRHVEREEKDVVLVCHSYSGMVASEAPKGFEKKERRAKGLKGGVVRVVYVMALVFPEDYKPEASGAGFPKWMNIDFEVSSATAVIHLPGTRYRP